ncbi:MAG: hypothetical protein ACRCZB_09765 [Bacteroidales bacterium]
MKKIMFILAILANCLFGGAVAFSIGLPIVVGAIGFNLFALVFGGLIPIGSLGAGLYTEVWTGEMIKAFRTAIASIGWLNKIRSYNQYVNADLIHFVNIGGDPNVLINNTTYPLNINSLDDADRAISLDKFDTEPTRVTDDELHAISYDKMGSVMERHKDAIMEALPARALHSIAPAGNTLATPVIVTTGADSEGRKMITRADILSLKKAFDKAKVPTTGRVLVLCADHVSDLLLQDQKFPSQYHEYATGKVLNLYGFEVYEYVTCPYYNATSKVKVAYGATPTADDLQASVAFYAPRMMKATGSLKVYASEAKNDAVNRESIIGYRQYFIAMPLKEEAIGAIVSAKV